MVERGIYRSWGRPPPRPAPNVVRPRWRDAALPRVPTSLLPYGNGRSYGDSCFVAGGTLIDSRGLDRFIRFDAERGLMRCEAGILLSDILRVVVPRGWFLPVTPGTRAVTLGGAIANDVHGKNHHRAGSFGHHVRCLELVRSDGTRIRCSREENADWFAATIGGLGLTGLMLWAEFALKPVPGPAVTFETLRFSSLEDFFELTSASHEDFDYTVAWLDSTRPSRKGVRGLFFRGNHAAEEGKASRPPRTKPGLPLTPPVSLVQGFAVKLFNALTYYRPRRRRSRGHYETFFYPLDAVPNWNRLYGRQGFFQHQSVIPSENARDGVRELIDRVAGSGNGSALSVLKVFGTHAPQGWLTFPRPGVTLALDIADRGHTTLDLLARLDEIVVAAGGAVYPAKDARMSAATFQQGFPRWRDLEAYRDPAFMSGFWARVTGRAS